VPFIGYFPSRAGICTIVPNHIGVKVFGCASRAQI
jgi:hypothetical protein